MPYELVLKSVYNRGEMCVINDDTLIMTHHDSQHEWARSMYGCLYCCDLAGVLQREGVTLSGNSGA